MSSKCFCCAGLGAASLCVACPKALQAKAVSESHTWSQLQWAWSLFLPTSASVSFTKEFPGLQPVWGISLCTLPTTLAGQQWVNQWPMNEISWKFLFPEIWHIIVLRKEICLQPYFLYFNGQWHLYHNANDQSSKCSSGSSQRTENVQYIPPPKDRRGLVKNFHSFWH